MNQYIPIFHVYCRECETTPVVGLETDEGTLHSTGLCGVCFFCDRTMRDWEDWNNPLESTE